MKNIAVIIVLFSSLMFAKGSNETNITAGPHSPDSTNSKLTPSYYLGAVLGGPIGVKPKFIVQNIFNNYELQVYGIHTFGVYSFGLDVNYVLYRDENFSHSIGLGGGVESGYGMEEKKFFNYGVGYDKNLTSAFVQLNYSFMWKIIFLQTGVAIGSNNYSVFRFRPQLGLVFGF